MPECLHCGEAVDIKDRGDGILKCRACGYVTDTSMMTCYHYTDFEDKKKVETTATK